ncbi:NAD(P)-binding domain-containing protein, partial [Achromobacter insolitus]
MEHTESPRIAFLGLGVMGSAMLRNLAAQGYAVSGYDVVPAAMERLADTGFRRAATPLDAARGCDVAITMLPTSS